MAYSDVVLADAPAIYWRLGETAGATTAVDASGNARNGTYTGSPTLGGFGLIMGDSDTAMRTNGTTGQYASVNDTADLTAFSVEAWITPTSTGGQRIIAARDNSTNAVFRLYLLGTQGYFTVTTDGTTHSGVQMSTSFPVGTTHHMVGTYDGTTIRLYVDGVEVANQAQTGALYTGDIPFSAGARSNGVWPFSGTIDEVAYYTTALSSARVGAHYDAGVGVKTTGDTATSTTQTGTVARATTVNQNATATDTGTVEQFAGEAKNTYEIVTSADVASTTASLTPNQAVTAVDLAAPPLDGSSTYGLAVMADSPVLYWRLGEASGTTAGDTSGNARAGTISGTPTMGTTGLLVSDANTAITFDGVNDKVVYASSVLTSSPAVSFECWVKISAAPSSTKYLADGNNVLLGVDSSGRLQAEVWMFAYNLVQGPVITDGAAHHIVVTAGGSVDKTDLWVDGIRYVTTSLLNSGTLSVPQLTVGNYRSSSYWVTGVIDEVAVYSTRLSKSRIRMHYSLGSGTPLMVDGTETVTALDGAFLMPTIDYTPVEIGNRPVGFSAFDGGSNAAGLVWETPGTIDFESGMPTGILHDPLPGTIVTDADTTTGTTKALQPADQGDSTVSWSQFVVNLTANTPLTFRYHAESEEDYDYGYLYFDGVPFVTSTGTFSWQGFTSTSLPPGLHVIRLQYEKDSSQSDGIDNIRLGQLSANVVVTDYEYRVDGGTPVALGSTATSTTVSGLSAGSHTFEVRSITASGPSGWTDPATVTITSGTLSIDGTADFSGTGTLTATGASAVGMLDAALTYVEMPDGAVAPPTPDIDVIDFDDYPQTGYRFFTFDIMSDKLLAEIPLSDVTFSVRLGEAGELSGTLPVGQLDYDLDAYGATMPMRTALYVLRNKKAVWGGIIWARDYDANAQTLQISCATWESYLFRRYMWHTYTTRDDVDQFEVVRQMMFKMRADFQFDYDAYDWVIPAPQSSTVDIFVNTRNGAGRTQDAMTFSRDEMKSFGEVLTEYANNLNGFEWFFRIDFNEKALRFRRRLELLRTPPALLPKGSDDPPYDEEHRPGIDTYLFEYPGNIASITLTEDGDNACTRQFVVGGYTASVAASAPKPIGSWNNVEYLEAGYPLVENVESSNHSTTYKMKRLMKLATVYGRDSAPPMRTWNIIVNGSLDPVVGTYRVGHWCRLVVNDPFLQRSLETSYDFDPLGGVVKRIVGYEVAVPNSPQTAELVTLELEDDPTVSFDLTHEEEQGSLLDDRGPFYYGTYLPDASTTGVVDVDALTDFNDHGDDAIVLQPGTVIADKIIYGDIFIGVDAPAGAEGGGAAAGQDGKPVILRRCRLVGGSNVPGSVRGVVNVSAGGGKVALKMFDCEIKPRTKSKRRDGVVGRGFEAYRVYVEHVPQAFVIDQGSSTSANLAVKVYGCWVGRLLRVDTRKARAVWHKSGRYTTVWGNRLTGYAETISDDSGDWTGNNSVYVIANNYADETVYIEDATGNGLNTSTVYRENYIARGTVETRIKSSVGAMVYDGNRHYWDVATDEASDLPGTYIWVDSRGTEVDGIETSVWKDGPYEGSNLMEPRAMGLYYEGA